MKHFSEKKRVDHNGEEGLRPQPTDTGRLVLFSFLITAAVMLLLWVWCPPHFTETNDDLMMASFSYGYMGEYSERLVFINTILGLLLKGLMQIMLNTPWYAILQCLTVYLSFSAIVYLLRRKFAGKRSIVPITALFLFFGYEFFCSLQFTKTAAAAVTAGVLFMFYAVSETKKVRSYLVAGAYILLGSLYRFRIFEMILIFVFAVGAAMLWERLHRKDWRGIVQLCVPFAVALVVCFGCYLGDRWSYNHFENWSGFWEYNALRDDLQNSKIDVDQSNGFPDYSTNEELYTSLGITWNDYQLYTSSNFADTELFTKDVVQALVEAKGNKPINASFLISFVLTIGKGMLQYASFPILCIAVFAAFFGLPKKKLWHLVVPIYLTLAFAGVQLYFFYRGRYLQSRTDISLIFAVFCILLLNCVEPDICLPSRRKTAILVSGALMISQVSYYYDSRHSYRVELENSSYMKVHELMTSDPDHFYFYYASWKYFPDKMYSIWNIGEKGCGANQSALGTWRVSTAMVQEKFENYGIQNPYRDMLEKDGIYVMCAADVQIQQVLTHIREHYDPNANAYMVKSVDNAYPIYKIAASEPELDTTNTVEASDDMYQVLEIKEVSTGLDVRGYLYGADINSFASNIYIGVTGLDGTELFYYTTQWKNEANDDLMNGEYGGFTRTIPVPENGSTISIYMESEGTLYKMTGETYERILDDENKAAEKSTDDYLNTKTDSTENGGKNA